MLFGQIWLAGPSPHRTTLKHITQSTPQMTRPLPLRNENENTLELTAKRDDIEESSDHFLWKNHCHTEHEDLTRSRPAVIWRDTAKSRAAVTFPVTFVAWICCVCRECSCRCRKLKGRVLLVWGRRWSVMDKLKEKSPVLWSLKRQKRNEQVKPGISHSDSYVTFHPQLLYDLPFSSVFRVSMTQATFPWVCP